MIWLVGIYVGVGVLWLWFATAMRNATLKELAQYGDRDQARVEAVDDYRTGQWLALVWPFALVYAAAHPLISKVRSNRKKVKAGLKQYALIKAEGQGNPERGTTPAPSRMDYL